MVIEVYQNVIFHEQSEISPTSAKWLVTFAIDLASYDVAFQSLEECIRNVQTGTREDFPQEFLGDVTFETLVKNGNDEFMEVKKEREHLLWKYDDYRSMAFDVLNCGQCPELPFWCYIGGWPSCNQ